MWPFSRKKKVEDAAEPPVAPRAPRVHATGVSGHRAVRHAERLARHKSSIAHRRKVHAAVAEVLKRRLEDPRFAHKHEIYRARLAELEAELRPAQP